MRPTPEEHRRIYEEQKARFEKARLEWTDITAAKAKAERDKNRARAMTKVLKVLGITVAVMTVGFYGSAVVAGVIGALSGDRAGDWELHMRDNTGKWHDFNAELKMAPFWTLYRCEAWGHKATRRMRRGRFADQAACKDLKTGQTVRFVPEGRVQGPDACQNIGVRLIRPCMLGRRFSGAETSGSHPASPTAGEPLLDEEPGR